MVFLLYEYIHAVCVVANSRQTVRKICMRTSGCLPTTKRSGYVIVKSSLRVIEERTVVRNVYRNKLMILLHTPELSNH